MPQDKNQPIIVLVRPQMGRNIGSSIRAMVNCGLTHLRLVSPRDGWPDQDAVDLSSGGMDHMTEIEVFETLEDALADCHYVLGTTARRRDMVKDVYTARSAAEKIKSNVANKEKTALLFGPERTGLLNDDIAHCQGVITIPLNPEFSSLNLAQAVLLVAYEWSQARDEVKIKPHDYLTGDSYPAEQKSIQEFLGRLMSEIDDGNFFRDPDVRPHMERNITNLFTRARPTDQEIKTLHGIVSALIGRKKARSKA